MDDQALGSSLDTRLSPAVYRDALRAGAALPRVCAPPEDLLRSPAALRVAELAVDSGLFLFDYEARVELEWPEAWLPADRPDLGVDGLTPEWRRGVLPEPKYAAFRHELLQGSLHAGQRAKWSAHELCHGLVGFAWREDGTALFHALAARLAETVPVALWYFWDEAWLRRCERHAGQQVLGTAYCPACEERAAAGFLDEDPIAEGRLRAGLEFVEREVAAALESARTGRPVFTPWAHIDLMSDGIAYASAHGHRLRSPEFQSWIARFAANHGEGGGWYQDLEAFAARVLEVARAIVASAQLTPWVHGECPAGLIVQDLGWRLLQIGADTDGECFVELDRLVMTLADAHRAADPGRAEAAIREVAEAYAALFDEYELPPPEDVFAVGTSLPVSGDPAGLGFGVTQLVRGLETATPRTLALLGDDAEAVVTRFAVSAPPSRQPLGRRLAAFLEASGVDVADVARLEAAIAHAEPPDTVTLGLGWDGAAPDGLRLARGVELVIAARDVAAIVMHDEAPDSVKTGRHAWLVRRDAGDQVGLTACGEGASRVIASGFEAGDDALDAQAQYELNLFAEEGFVVPDRWELEVPHEARAPAH